MLEVNSTEVVAAQAAGQYVQDCNERSRTTTIETLGSGVRMYMDIRGTHFSFPVNVNQHDSTRVGDIIVIIDFDDKVFGCFLR